MITGVTYECCECDRAEYLREVLEEVYGMLPVSTCTKALVMMRKVLENDHAIVCEHWERLRNDDFDESDAEDWR